VDLQETSATLELLFQFIYPQRHPALDTTPFEVLAPLAEASEKYQVFPAMNICHIRMRDMVHQHPVEVAVYATKHDYPFLVSEVAPMMISMDSVKVIEMLPPNLILPWIRYVQEWTHVLHNSALVLPPGFIVNPHNNNAAPVSAFGGYPTGYSSSCSWTQYIVTILQRLGAGVQALRSLETVFDMNTPDVDDCCQRAMAVWRRQIEDGISNIPKFSTFL